MSQGPMSRVTRGDDRLDIIISLLQELLKMSGTQTNSLANLQAAVAAETVIDQKVEALLTSLVAELQAASPTGDNPAIDAVVATMQANATALSAAVTAATPTGATGATGP
jgi:hypothetical protein